MLIRTVDIGEGRLDLRSYSNDGLYAFLGTTGAIGPSESVRICLTSGAFAHVNWASALIAELPNRAYFGIKDDW